MTNDEIALYARVVGLRESADDTRIFLEGVEPARWARILAACRTQQPLFHDPIEDESALALAFEQARALALAEVGRDSGIGYGQRIWSAKKRILRERFGIQWFTPAEMNPDVQLD